MGRKRTRRPAARGIVLPRISLLASRGCRTSLRHGVLVSSGPDPIVMPDAGFPDHIDGRPIPPIARLVRQAPPPAALACRSGGTVGSVSRLAQRDHAAADDGGGEIGRAHV